MLSDQQTVTPSPPQAPTAEEELYCPQCSYELRGLSGNQCPECGETFDLEQLRKSQIPWTYRKKIGRFRAYWRTVWLVTFRNARFCREVAKPVSYRDAQLFRWVTILHVWAIPLVLTVLIYGVWIFSGPIGESWLNMALLWVWPVVTAHVLLLLFLLGVTGVPSYWFHPRSLSIQQQNRAVALSYYACAPLAWMPLTVAAFGVGWAYHSFYDFHPLTNLSIWVGALPAALQLVCWWMVPIQMAKRTAQRGAGALVVFAAALPIAWLLLGALICLGIPLTIGYVWLVTVSLR